MLHGVKLYPVTCYIHLPLVTYLYHAALYCERLPVVHTAHTNMSDFFLPAVCAAVLRNAHSGKLSAMYRYAPSNNAS